MEIYETIAWIAVGFIPTLLAMEAASRLARGYKLHRRSKETATEVVVGMIGIERR
jgi:hypothetical protein